jgi:hypothetical protein
VILNYTGYHQLSSTINPFLEERTIIDLIGYLYI